MAVRTIGWHAAALALASLCFMSAAAGPAEAADEKRVALVIGNSAYQNVSALPNPVNDAGDMAQSLGALGFEVTFVTDIGKAAMDTALADFSDRAAGADIAVVYFAGHGIEVDRQNYVIPVDAKLETDRRLLFETVPLDFLIASLDAVKGLRIILLDACRNNPFATSMRRSSATRSIGRGLSRIEAPNGTLISYAAKDGAVADDGDGRNSPFTSALIANIAEPGLDIRVLFGRVRDSVIETTGGRQEPYVSASLPGKEIYLVPPVAGNAAGLSDTGPTPTPAPTTEPAGNAQARDYELAAKIDTKGAWEAFLAQHGDSNSFYVQLARESLAKLTGGTAQPQAQPNPEVAAIDDHRPGEVAGGDNTIPSDPFELARAVQAELARLGCEPGKADGVWGAGSQRALDRFNNQSGLALATSDPAGEVLAALNRYDGRVCPLDCGPRFNAVENACVPKTCPQGQTLSQDGACLVAAPSLPAPIALALPGGSYTSSFGAIGLQCGSNGRCSGSYKGTADGDPARISGQISADGRLAGYWIEVGSAKRCDTTVEGSYYWGRVDFRFNAARDSWSGTWGYCNDQPGRSWNGNR